MKCKLCQEFYNKYPLTPDKEGTLIHSIYPNHSMSPITCYFENSKENWNCETVNLIRSICWEYEQLKPGITYQYCDDQKYAVIDISEVLLNDTYIGLSLWLTWYKNRGGTDALWILDSYREPKKPTEEELIAIYSYYETK
jgi:hypothetical protein